MRFSFRQAVGMVLGYLLLAAAPLLLAYLGPLPEPRPFWVEFGVGLGFVGMGVLGLQFLLTGRFRNVASSVGLDLMLQFHREVGIVAFLLILAHPVILFATDPTYLEFLDPRVNLPRALALSSVLAALVLLVVTTLWRQELKISYEWWRTGHGVLALFVILIGLVHGLQVGHYLSPVWKQVIWVVLTLAAVGLLLKNRVIRPLRLKKRPFQVVEVREESPGVWTLALEPRGHGGVDFRPGQFVWLTLGSSPFSLQQHPFSISSSAEEPGRVELTIAELGDFTSGISSVPSGTTAFLEGPYGAFVPEEAEEGEDGEPGAAGAVFIVGGVGITPVMSMLRTFRDRGDSRPIVLVHGAPSEDRALFRDEVEALSGMLDFKTVHVLEEAPDSWEGERGLVTPEVLDRHLPEDGLAEWEYFVCGPPPMMDAVEQHLRSRGVPASRIFSERFNIV
ncbi:MAG: hypothetical protein EA352_03285 [Gemmatimonadales bacterium]|nr:MAG: hypothetical protein EA352_03285 [Gemmatimonadales bacterium]